eukprot:TRINITY_DN31807_c0_g1_i1.p1 TRINITY_DN31807_c0_g1~~TRINITY_DN31807_c0_g1_i1.p1  ORF type:complete len:429 (+),score=69.29 TRINITY_DN31807_c0_g1_i1:170-1456(+)
MPADRRELRAELQRRRQSFPIRVVLAATGEELLAELCVRPHETIGELGRRLEALGLASSTSRLTVVNHLVEDVTMTSRLTLRELGLTAGDTLEVLRVQKRLLVSSSFDRTIRLWDFWSPSGQECEVVMHTDRAPVCMSADVASERLLVGFAEGSLELMSLRARDFGQRLKVYAGHPSAITTVAALWSDGLAVSAGPDSLVMCWDLAESEPLHRLKFHTDQILRVMAGRTPDARLLAASASADGVCVLWDLRQGQKLHKMTEESGKAGVRAGVMSVAVDWSSLRALTGLDTGYLRLWQLHADDDRGTVLRTLSGHRRHLAPAAVWTVSASWASTCMQQELVLSGGADAKLRLWDLGTGAQLCELLGHAAVIWGVSVDWQAGVLVSCSHDGTLRVWELQEHQGQGESHWTGRCNQVLDGHSKSVVCCVLP